MKKYHILAAMFLTAMTFTACTDDDFTDWAQPQSNNPEDAAAKFEINFSAGADATVNMDEFYTTVAEEERKTDSVEIVKMSASDAKVASILLNGIQINGICIPASLTAGNAVKVNTLELDSIVRAAYFSRAHIERVLKIDVNASAKLVDGQAVNIQGTTSATLIPVSTPNACDSYMLLGDFVENGNGWDPSTPVVMLPVSGKEGVFQAVVETKNEGSNWFKFYEGFDPAGGWDAANKGEMGCQKNGDDSSENFLVWRGDVFALNCPTITGQGHFQVTLDAVNFTYSIAPAKAYLYMAGDANKWSHVDALSSPSFNNIYKGYMYLNQNGFKFCTEANWNGTNYGADFSTARDAGNIIMSEPEGFYQVIVDLNEKSYALTAISTIGLIGDATPGGWSEDTPMEYDKENRCWVVTTDIGEGEFKFRANKDWGINWGGEKDNLTQDGANLKEAPGRYTIKLYPLCEGMSHYTIEAAK